MTTVCKFREEKRLFKEIRWLFVFMVVGFYSIIIPTIILFEEWSSHSLVYGSVAGGWLISILVLILIKIIYSIIKKEE
jgi:uncharacterized membrane protein (DUF485 family)